MWPWQRGLRRDDWGVHADVSATCQSQGSPALKLCLSSFRILMWTFIHKTNTVLLSAEFKACYRDRELIRKVFSEIKHEASSEVVFLLSSIWFLYNHRNRPLLAIRKNAEEWCVKQDVIVWSRPLTGAMMKKYYTSFTVSGLYITPDRCICVAPRLSFPVRVV